MPEPDLHPDAAGADLVEDEEDLPLRWYVIAGFMAAVTAGFAVAVLLSVSWFSACHDRHGGSPYVADDSLRAQVCEGGHGAAGLLVALGWVAGSALATFALLRWRPGPALRLTVLGGLLVTPVLLPAAAYAALSTSSTTCPEDKQQAYRAWVDSGSKGSAPYECRTF